MKPTAQNVADAEALALRAVAFLAAEPERADRFLALSGVTPAQLPTLLGERAFLCGVLEYLLADETLLYVFADHADVAPDQPAAALRLLAAHNDGDLAQ